MHSTTKCVKNCQIENLYDYYDECYSECDNDYYTEDGKNICKCLSKISCKDCPLENNSDNLCSRCNNDLGYYPLKEEKDHDLKNCYTIDSIPYTNYILNIDQSMFDPCYSSCRTCDQVGNPSYHQCKECKEGFYKLLDNDNCYEECSHYYYFKENNEYVCLNENICPTDYKLIAPKKKCILNCKDDNIFHYIYEYHGECYSNCPKGTYIKNEIEYCKCLDNIECNDCPLDDNPEHLCSSCNEGDGYYPKKEEKDNQLKHCYTTSTIESNYIFIENDKVFESCYSSCGTCEHVGDALDHQCKDCKDNTYSKLLNNNNCYEICPHYYYFNDNNEYICLNEDKCPTNYKLINSKKKCIKICNNDNIFDSKKEYHGECYKNCPKGTYIENEIEYYKYFDIIECNDCILDDIS